MKISGIPLFKTTSPNLPTPTFIWEKFEHSPFFQNFEKSTAPLPPLYKGGVQTMQS